MLHGHDAVRLMNDYSAVWPLWWSDGGQTREDDLPLSAALRDDLLAWARHFETHFDAESGWDDDGSRVNHGDTARDLVERLEGELSGVVAVRADLWELRV